MAEEEGSWAAVEAEALWALWAGEALVLWQADSRTDERCCLSSPLVYIRGGQP